VEAAGGVTGEADVEQLNLAEKLLDGERVHVTRRGESPPAPAPTSGSSSPASPSGAGSVVNINTASADQLDALPGVGPSTAQAIIDYRTAHGPFTSVDDLAAVKGIGPAKLAQLKDKARV
jgi:competence protein ComEA